MVSGVPRDLANKSMSYVLAIESSRGQAEVLLQDVGSMVGRKVRIVDSMGAATQAIDEEVPHLVLVSALMPPHEERELFARLQDVPRGTAPQILILPSLGSPEIECRKLTLFGRPRNRNVRPARCDPSVFADQVLTYLDEADRRSKDASLRHPATPVPLAVPPASLVSRAVPPASLVSPAVPPAGLVPPAVKNEADRRAGVRLERLDWAKARIDGAAVELVDLSFTGAQVLAPIVLRPGRSVQVLLSREAHLIHCEAGIVWGGFEIAGAQKAPCYRAGMHFREADQSAIERFYFLRD